MAMDPKDPRRFRRILNTMQSGISNVQSSIQTSIQRQGNSTFYTASIQQQKSLKCGWLKKQGGVVKSWHRRWFTIKGDHMYYFQSDDESKSPLGYIFLPGNKVVEYPFNSSEPDKFLFEIQPGGEKPRMTSTHETYPLDACSDDERKEWVQVIRRVMYAERGGAIFGQSLEEMMKFEMKFNRKVPQIVEMCVEYLTHHGLETEGIFRLPGRASVIRQLREMFDCGERPDLFAPETEADFNTIASLLKQYLRELPLPIIPPCFYERVMKAVIRVMPYNSELGLEELSTVLHEIPSVNYNLLQYICKFLDQVSQRCDQNKMTDNNLATVFAQCIIRPEDEDPALLMGTAGNRTQVVLVLIRHHENVFKMEYNIDGSSIMVDNLLDFTLESSTNNNFNAGNASYFAVPNSSSLEKDLLGLDLGSAGVAEDLQAPIHPSASQDRLNLIPNGTNLANVDINKNDFVEYSNETFYSVSSDFHDDEEIEDLEEEEEEPVFGSIRASKADVLTDSKLETEVQQSQNYGSVMMRSNSKKKLPVPPPRPSKRNLPSTSSEDLSVQSRNSANGEHINTTAAENKRVDQFLETDLDSLSHEDLHVFTESLRKEFKIQRSRVTEQQVAMETLKQAHKAQIHKMAEKIDKEREATAHAVDKVVVLQNQIQEYQLRHSNLLE